MAQSVPWKLVENLFFNKGLISDLILFWKGRQARSVQEKPVFLIYTHMFFDNQHWVAKKICHNSEPSKHYMVSE